MRLLWGYCSGTLKCDRDRRSVCSCAQQCVYHQPDRDYYGEWNGTDCDRTGNRNRWKDMVSDKLYFQQCRGDRLHSFGLCCIIRRAAGTGRSQPVEEQPTDGSLHGRYPYHIQRLGYSDAGRCMVSAGHGRAEAI